MYEHLQLRYFTRRIFPVKYTSCLFSDSNITVTNQDRKEYSKGENIFELTGLGKIVNFIFGKKWN